MYYLGFDVGSSSVKVALVDANNGKLVDLIHSHEREMAMHSENPGWAEQDPAMWWSALCDATQKLLRKTKVDPKLIRSIGISYQMHGLVLIDKNYEVLRPSIIWCDSRAVEIGDQALNKLGVDYCFDHLLNSPGNFTASKLRWVKENEPEVYEKIYKILLPGDYIAMKLTGVVNTTISGLSEGIFWDFKESRISEKLLDCYEINEELIPDIVDTFDMQGKVTEKAAIETGLEKGIPVTYRAGDQPNNAMSLGVLNPGEVAATGGTSGVVYGISDQIISDKASRINAFAHVNHTHSKNRIGQLLCINGAGSQYAWVRKYIAESNQTYGEMEKMASKISYGSEGLFIHPFGNGAERMLRNYQSGGQISGLQFNVHNSAHFFRAALEGIAFSFVYGLKFMEQLGISANKMRVGNDNLFQSNIFAGTICNLIGCNIEMVDTTGAAGAAQASGIAIGDFDSPEEAIKVSETVRLYEPDKDREKYLEVYANWLQILNQLLE